MIIENKRINNCIHRDGNCYNTVMMGRFKDK